MDCDVNPMRMEKNGRMSCGPKSRHVDIRYFWFQDRIEKGEFDIVHCPTHKMIADFFTKPLQGELFRKLRAVIMGHVSLEAFMSEVSVASKECVGDNNCEVHEQTTEMSQTDKESKTVSWGVSNTRAGHDVVQQHNMTQVKMSYVEAVKKRMVRS